MSGSDFHNVIPFKIFRICQNWLFLTSCLTLLKFSMPGDRTYTRLYDNNETLEKSFRFIAFLGESLEF